jgi:hypothetical protein
VIDVDEREWFIDHASLDRSSQPPVGRNVARPHPEDVPLVVEVGW